MHKPLAASLARRALQSCQESLASEAANHDNENSNRVCSFCRNNTFALASLRSTEYSLAAVTQTADPQPPRPEADEVRQQLAGKHACPFCGVIRVDAQAPCPRCTMEDTPATRQATRQRIGPWFVLQARNPSAPGMKFATLVSLIKKNHVTPRSIVRGPTTHQLWTFAAQVRGLSREFGLCYSCGEAIDPAAKVCPHCDRQQMPPPDPDALLEAGAPEMVVTSQLTTHDTGMDGGTSLDLQADAPAGPPRPIRTPPPAQQQALARVTPRPATPIREALPAAKEESILTARELAAAFQLDFNPQNRRPRKKIGTGQSARFAAGDRRGIDRDRDGHAPGLARPIAGLA